MKSIEEVVELVEESHLTSIIFRAVIVSIYSSI